MGKTKNSRSNKKLVAHTPYDKRYKWENQVLMKACPLSDCIGNKTLVVKKANGYAWTFCTSCECSGNSEKHKVSNLTGWEDVYYTIVDANADE